MPGHDGHGAEPRALRRERARARGAARARASRSTATGASSRCTATSCSACPRERFEAILEARRDAARAAHDSELSAAELEQVARDFLAIVREHTRRAVSAGSRAAALGRRGRGVPLLAQRARAALPAPARDPGVARHRGQRAGDGVRQHGRRLRDRRRVHARPERRHARVLRRVPRERAGRGRGGGHPHAAPDQRARARARHRAPADARGGDAARLPRAGADRRPARAPLPRHAGHRVHDPARPAVAAADAHGQAHRARRGADRGRPGARAADPPRRGDRARRPAHARRAAASDARSRTCTASPSRAACPRRRARRSAWWCCRPTPPRRARARARR